MKIKDFIYINRYPNKDCKCVNKLLVIGFLRKYFNFKLFYYINL